MTVAELSEAAGRTDARTADLTVVGGAGHVGIPLVLSFAAKGLRVNVNDLNLDNLAALKSGRLPFIEYGAGKLLTDALRDQRLIFTSKPGEISGSGPVIVTIGTPVDEFLNPERQVIQDCIDRSAPASARWTAIGAAFDALSRHHRLDQCVPRRARDATSRSRSARNGSCKVMAWRNCARMPQIVSGTSAEAAEEAAALFRIHRPGNCRARSDRGRIRQIVRQRLSLH